MLGLEPLRRNRTSTPKSRVSKSKKEPKAKKEDVVKQDPTAGPDAGCAIPKAESPKIKRETSQAAAQSQAAVPAAAVSLPDAHTQYTQFHARLLTPCSDSDLLPTSQSYAASPASDMFHSEPPFDFAASAHCSHEHESWAQNSPYPAFGMPYEMDSYAAGFCEHQQTHHHHSDDLCLPSAVLEPHPNEVNVKNEEWDAHYHEI